MAITDMEVEKMLEGCGKGSELFVSYLAGSKKPPTARALEEAEKAHDMGIPTRWLNGKLENKWRTKKGDFVVCVFTQNRYNADDPNAEGQYRTFNASLGQLLSLEVVSRVEEGTES